MCKRPMKHLGRMYAFRDDAKQCFTFGIYLYSLPGRERKQQKIGFRTRGRGHTAWRLVIFAIRKYVSYRHSVSKSV